jgi:preprotein translocase subunit Sss1
LSPGKDEYSTLSNVTAIDIDWKNMPSKITLLSAIIFLINIIDTLIFVND